MKEARDGGRGIRDVWQWLGTSGDAAGTNGARVFWAAVSLTAGLVAIINTLNIITIRHDNPKWGLAGPIIWEATSWVALMAFLWIPWIGFRLAPPLQRPWWRVAVVHPVGAFVFGVCHVSGFVFLRKAIYWVFGAEYDFGAVVPNFLYEFSKDWMGYAMQVVGFALFARLLQPAAQAPGETMYTIRDGARIVRVPLRDILAVASAGNYVEFALRDGRRVLMRSPLSAIEAEFAAHGFVRVHRSWLVNAMQMTGLKPEGSGDYTVELGALNVPLSRRFPDALARLRAT
ncbi:MAG: response regulator transcription factor [Alphaproteobacteria bacterium]|nr:response regulator transcription factor [Alphaproteobacteria bacterium]MBL6940333.1 response regulator transcription factor [Alphaproteobacteria bacterium]MBL7098209.1 response regulator transcription factor [Alphaproteobacteria bacterium]